MSARSLTLQVGLGPLRIILLVLVASFIFLGGCIPTEGTLSGDAVEDGRLPIAQLQQIAREYYETEDESVLDPITLWSDAELVIDLVAELEGGYEDWENQEEDGARWSSGLPDCNNLFAWYRYSTWAHYVRRSGSNYSFYWSPNCYISEADAYQEILDDNPNAGSPCGGDGDNLVSFWMGADYRVDHNYKVDSTGNIARIWLLLKEQVHGNSGASNVRMNDNSVHGNAYFCLPRRYNPERLRLGR